MHDAYNTKPSNIGELIGASNTAKLVVPKFQRAYSWKAKHVEALWRDILTFDKQSLLSGGPARYFFGPIVLMDASETQTKLLDGQQRVATATIIFSILRDIAVDLDTEDTKAFAHEIQTGLICKDFDDATSYAIELSQIDRLHFQETIQQKPSIKRKPTSRSHVLIDNAKKILTKAVKSQVAGMAPNDALKRLKRLRKILRNDLIMACIPVKSERDAFRIFETLNDRGLRLSPSDLLLNHLMGEAPESDHDDIRLLWDEMLEGLGRGGDIAEFLRHLWVSKHGDLKSEDLFTALKAKLESTEVKSIDFVRSCATECTSYRYLLAPNKAHLKNATKYVQSLVIDLDIKPSLPLLLVGYQLLSPSNFTTLAKWLLVFVVRYDIVGNLESAGMENILFSLAREMRAQLGVGSNEGQFMKTMKARLREKAPDDERVIADSAHLVLDPDDSLYVISRLANRLQSKTKEVVLGESTLEHVYPKKPKANEWGGPANQAELRQYLWHIGNLTMLGDRLNKDDVQNKEYPDKRACYGTASELRMAQAIAKNYSKWDKASIEDRAGKLAQLVAEVWNFDNPSRA